MADASTVYSFDEPGCLPFGELQGYAPGGIPAYSNFHDHYFSGERSIDGNFFCGFKYQCVEFARRWLFERKGLILPDVNWACHIFALKEVKDAVTAQPVPVVTCRNGGPTRPEVDTLLIYASSEMNVVGHVAAITEVGEDYICVCDQNYRFHKWEGNYACKLRLSHEGDKWTVIDDLDPDDIEIPLGWVSFPHVANRPENATPIKLHPSLYFQPPPRPTMRRITFTPEKVKDHWLDLSNPAEKLFVHEFGMDVSRGRLHETEASYYAINQEMYLLCVAYGAQLHAIFLEATGQVIASDEQLRVFDIPEEFWPRLRYSWAHYRTFITGRFDFAFNHETGAFKCFEYNADSASTLLECGRIQRKWADSVGLEDGHTRSGGFFVDRNLRLAWSRCGAKGRVHFCVDNDQEEQYTALYAMEAAADVGLETRLCVLFDEFHFNAEGKVVDSENVPVRNIWKTWMWETAFADYFAAKKERGPHWRPSVHDKVRLCDLVLSEDWSIMVFEPMWKVIPSNKAILPIIYHNHPTHPAILKAEYELTDELRASGYVTKPIVGRVGRNVTITAGSGEVVAKSGGNFDKRDRIYQELFTMSKHDDYYPILGGWMIGDAYSGTGVREDKTKITGLESPFAAVRIVLDQIVRPLTHDDLDKMPEDE